MRYGILQPGAQTFAPCFTVGDHVAGAGEYDASDRSRRRQFFEGVGIDDPHRQAGRTRAVAYPILEITDLSRKRGKSTAELEDQEWGVLHECRRANKEIGWMRIVGLLSAAVPRGDGGALVHPAARSLRQVGGLNQEDHVVTA